MAARANEAVAGVQGSLPSQGWPGTAPPATVSRRQVVLTARPTAGSGGPNGGASQVTAASGPPPAGIRWNPPGPNRSRTPRSSRAPARRQRS